MPRGREISASFKQAVFAQETAEVFLLLVTISHNELLEPLRLVSNTENILSRGQLYYICPMQIELPIDAESQTAAAKITMDALDKTIVATLRSISSAPTFTLELIKASDPDTIEMAIYDLVLKQVNYDYHKIEGVLTYEDMLSEPWPTYDFTPNYFPGLF